MSAAKISNNAPNPQSGAPNTEQLSAESMTKVIETLEGYGFLTTDLAEDESDDLRQLIRQHLYNSVVSFPSASRAAASPTCSCAAQNEKTTIKTSQTSATSNSIKKPYQYMLSIDALRPIPPSRNPDFRFSLPKSMLNSKEKVQLRQQLCENQQTLIVDVAPDGSCLFHSVFASLWRALTGRFVIRYQLELLQRFWRDASFYDVESALERFSPHRYEAVLAAIWHACTRAMRLYVVATQAFGTRVFSHAQVVALLRANSATRIAQDASTPVSVRYLLKMLQTIELSLALERFARSESDLLHDDVADDRDDYFAFTLAMAAQQLLDRVEQDTRDLRREIRACREWVRDADDDSVKESFRLLAAEGYENSRLVDDEKIRAASLAMLHDHAPKNCIIRNASMWASITACGFLASALGFDINVVVPDRKTKTMRIETFSCGADSSVLFDSLLCGGSTQRQKTQRKPPPLALYMMGERNHFGYGVTREAMVLSSAQQERVASSSSSCSSLSFSINSAAMQRVIGNVELLCSDFIVANRIDAVAHCYERIARWRMFWRTSSIVCATSDGVEKARIPFLDEALTVIDLEAMRDDVDRILRSESVLARAWTAYDFLDAESASLTPENLELNLFDIFDARGKRLPVQNDTRSSGLQFYGILNESVARLVGQDGIDSTVFSLVVRLRQMQRSLSSLLSHSQIDLSLREHLLVLLAKDAPFPVAIADVTAEILMVFNSIGRQDSSDAVCRALDVLVERYNEWLLDEYEPFVAAIRRDCDSALRYVIARLRRSLAQPGVVPLFILGEQMMFIDSRRFSLVSDADTAARSFSVGTSTLCTEQKEQEQRQRQDQQQQQDQRQQQHQKQQQDQQQQDQKQQQDQRQRQDRQQQQDQQQQQKHATVDDLRVYQATLRSDQTSISELDILRGCALRHLGLGDTRVVKESRLTNDSRMTNDGHIASDYDRGASTSSTEFRIQADLYRLVFDSMSVLFDDEAQKERENCSNVLLFGTSARNANFPIRYEMDDVQRAIHRRAFLRAVSASSSSSSSSVLPSSNGAAFRNGVHNANNRQEGSIVREGGVYRESFMRGDDNFFGGVVDAHALCVLNTERYFCGEFGWLGAHLRCSTYYPGRGDIDLLQIVPQPANADAARITLPRLAMRFYVLYQSCLSAKQSDDGVQKQRFFPLELRGNDIRHRLQPVDESFLLSPLQHLAELQQQQRFYGHEPTDSRMLMQLRRFFNEHSCSFATSSASSNSSVENRDALFDQSVLERLEQSMLYGTAGRLRADLCRSMGFSDHDCKTTAKKAKRSARQRGAGEDDDDVGEEDVVERNGVEQQSNMENGTNGAQLAKKRKKT